jgi:hypothetical protein
MAVCRQNLTRGALSSRSAPSTQVGVLFKKFGFFFNTPLPFLRFGKGSFKTERWEGKTVTLLK